MYNRKLLENKFRFNRIYKWYHCLTPLLFSWNDFRITDPFERNSISEWQSNWAVGIIFTVSLSRMLERQSSYWWFEMKWRLWRHYFICSVSCIVVWSSLLTALNGSTCTQKDAYRNYMLCCHELRTAAHYTTGMYIIYHHQCMYTCSAILS